MSDKPAPVLHAFHDLLNGVFVLNNSQVCMFYLGRHLVRIQVDYFKDNVNFIMWDENHNIIETFNIADHFWLENPVYT